ncbi:MAG: HNH endonuclease [Candidatus Daviesbacteria bacterium]|nr:HNH endonuclease [Candidatus Daviesbacteria bacterium]
MQGSAYKYTKEKLEDAVSKSISVQGVARIILGKPVSGNQHRHIKKMIQKFGIDSSHFLGYRHMLGIPSNKKKLPAQIFIIGQRQKSFHLRRALLESGVEYECLICGINKWKDIKLNLEIDHIDGNSEDNRIENLRFLCPNCHSQTNTFGYRGKNTL